METRIETLGTGSDDLHSWHVIGAKTSSDGQIGFDLSDLKGVPLRFFRAVSVSD